jgi:hypothetical protein
MTKGYLGWRGVIKLAKELGYSWQEACEVLYRKKINPKTTFDQIIKMVELLNLIGLKMKFTIL